MILLAAAAGALFAQGPVEFNRDVRPILSDKCFVCHGPDAAAKKVPLRLDVEAAAKADLGGGRRPIVEGDPAASQMIRRITAETPALRMPPAWSGLKLTEREIETLRIWVAQGAKWQKHWSFIPPERPPLPAVKNKSWPRTPIDYFILERLEREGLQPSPKASPETSLRRVYLDLTGLPPTPAEIDAFLTDKSPDAYENVVDRLLASSRYGERMAARWLDAARYADTNGYQYDGERFMWRWRDWVIGAFNRNLPFDQFTLWQIAGDMFPNATLEQKIATGFNRNHRTNAEGGIVPEEYAVEYVVDRVETTATVFLGMTWGCARCHNHKYDPFTQKEFYRVSSYFDNVPELGRGIKVGNSSPVVPAPTEEQQRALNDLDRRIQALEDLLRKDDAILKRKQSNWERGPAKSGSAYWAPSSGLVAAFPMDGAEKDNAKEGSVSFVPGQIGLAASFDGEAYLDAGDTALFDIDDTFTFSAWVHSDSVPDGSLLSRMQDSPDGRGYGVYLNKGKVYVHLTNSASLEDGAIVETQETLNAGRWHHVAVAYTGSARAEGFRTYIDGQPAKLKVLVDMLYRPFREQGRGLKFPFRIGAGPGRERRFRGLIDEVRIYSRVLEQEEIAVLALGRPVHAIAAKPPVQRTEAERNYVHWYFLENAAPQEVQAAWRQLTALRRARESLERSFPTVMIMAESPQPKETRILIRGAYDHPGEKVEPGVPAALHPLPAGAPNNRLGFARWLIDPANPLTARVTVNRFWQMYFGTGLVKTVEDFGAQGEWPSHPELLNWLATEFIRTGWDVKALLRLIATSATYQQSSHAMPELLQRDPENRLLARGPRFRLPSETIRDQALWAAGLLVEKIGGPSVKPYQPPGLWKETSMQDNTEYIQGKGADLYRRSLYTFWRRTIPPPLMVNFDAPTRETCVVQQSRSNTPLQALNLMNDVTFLEAGRFLGQRMLKEGGKKPSERLRYGFRLATARGPTAEEEKILTENLFFHLDYFATDPRKATDYLSHGESPPDSTMSPLELAAYSAVAGMILNLDETVTKE
jgi:hypothetical protein